ncbi:lactoylglutathione lyase-like lyase [Frankia torreyi]|uniref:Lactoylglutathione lyase-like lyase n=1 Tax=Frankia torreyi TaxID=1856 RepID=A0A0D8BEM9_9ACTN|nr:MULTISPECIES: VOC family protein [Frankia]KJE22515.1 lactoylglutathione lyase-like lyase [Frankia torreyi]KQC38280.1 lactoylglutathione lyase [Frankia sp. ACN1ag]KQM04554.1 lactoylglutathione lyase-like lyase [Frankia sp. CpI1-P]
MTTSTESTASGAPAPSPAGDPAQSARPAHHAHAVLHCNLNTVDVDRSAAFHLALFAGEPRMRSISTDGDTATMGLGTGTASVTTFLYDLRGPRSAPAVELVGWTRPHTTPATADQRPTGFSALGYRVESLRIITARLEATGVEFTPVPEGLAVRGAVRPALRLTDPDGAVIEVVEIPAAPGDPRRLPLLSHERMRCTDLERTIAWYTGIGWTVRDRGESPAGPTASLVLPEDPTFSLEFIQQPAPAGATATPPANVQGLYRIALAVEDVREAHASLVADGALGDVDDPVVMPMPDTPTGGFTVLFLHDPDGAVVEFVDRPRSAVRRPTEPA